MSSDLLHADDTPIRVLDRSRRDKGLGKGVKQGRIWTYVRDQRPWAGQDPPGAVYYFSPDRKGEHPRKHLARSSGVLQADAYTGFKDLYERRADGTVQFREAAVLGASAPRFPRRLDIHQIRNSRRRPSTGSASSTTSSGRSPASPPSSAVPFGRTSPNQQVEAFRAWAEQQLTRIPGKSDLAKAFRYGLGRWDSFCLFLEDGRVAIDNNPAERGMRPIGRRPAATGSLPARTTGGETLARAMTIIETAKMNDLDPQAYLADILDRIHDHKVNRLAELLAMELGARDPVAQPGSVMAATTYVCSIAHVATRLGEDP